MGRRRSGEYVTLVQCSAGDQANRSGGAKAPPHFYAAGIVLSVFLIAFCLCRDQPDDVGN